MELDIMFPVHEVGNDEYWLCVNDGKQELYAKTTLKFPATWKALLDEAIAYCNKNGIALWRLERSGMFRHTLNGSWYKLPFLARAYLFWFVKHSKHKK